MADQERIEDLETLYGSMNEGVCVHEIVCDEAGNAVDYRITDVNPSYENITGIPKAEAVGSLASVLYSTGNPPFLEIYARVAKTQVPESFEIYWPPMNKHFRVSVVSPRKGKFATIFFDITDIVESKAAAQRSEQQYRDLFNNYPIGLVISRTEDGRMSNCNDYIAGLLGYDSRQDCIDNYTAEKHYYRTQDREFMVNMLKESGSIANYEVQIRDTAGQLKWVSYTARLDKEAGLLEGAALDITELKQSQLFNETILETSPDIIYIYDIVEKKNIYSNERINEVLGYTIAEIKAMGETLIQTLMHPDDFVNYLNETLQKYQAAQDGELIEHQYRMKHKAGHWCWLYSKELIFARQEDGSPKQIFGMIADVTDRRALEERLHQGEKMQAIGQLAGGIAHDFNNQLAAILGFAELLQDELNQEPRLSHFINGIQLATKRASDLTAQLLAFARKGKYLSVRVEMHKMIAEVVDILRHTIDRRIRINQLLNAPSPFIKGDPSQIQNLLMNLALNARDAMPEGGEISFLSEEISLDEVLCRHFPSEATPGKYLQICVVDTGTGMDAQTQKRMFEPFFTTKPPGKGTGMGLAAVYGTVKNHNGVIDVESHPGQGTTMKLYLPLATGEVSRERPEPSVLVQRPGESHILLVDDEEMILDVASYTLKRLGYSVTSCSDGVKAVDYYKNNWQSVDLVILDMVMPHLSGKATYTALKNINPDLVVLVSSGYSLSGEAQEILDAGANGFLQKPFEKLALANKIRQTLESPQSPHLRA